MHSFPYEIEVEDANGNEIHVDFSMNGWIGTVSSLPKLKELTEKIISESPEDADKITISDNRISLYSRGKLGEYDVLPKIKNNRNSEAYVIGELYQIYMMKISKSHYLSFSRRLLDPGYNLALTNRSYRKPYRK